METNSALPSRLPISISKRWFDVRWISRLACFRFTARRVSIWSTRAKQLGLYLAIYSPIQMAADLIDNLAQYPRELEFIAQVPADWEHSRLIVGEVGDYAIFARKDRHSGDWYVGGVNDGTGRETELDFGFLEDGMRYTATIYRDTRADDQ